MSEKGKNIIIDFTEREESIFKAPGDLQKFTVTGEVSVINSSDAHRLWNTILSLKGLEMVTSDLASDIKIGEIRLKGKWSAPYTVKSDEIPSKASLKLTEVINTYYEKATVINWALVLNHRMPVSFTLSLENPTSKPITKINLVKHLPEIFGEPIIDPPSQGDIKFDTTSRNIIWNDFSLAPGGAQSLIIRVGFEPDQIDPVPSGNIDVNYVVPELIRTKLVGTTVSQSDSMFAIDQGESLEEPGEWDCTAEFQNNSDFLMELRKAQVQRVLEGGRKELVVQESPNLKLAPNNSWKKDFKVKSGVVPKFSNVHEFIVVPVITTKIVGHIFYEAGALPVAAIKGEKIIDPPAVSAYTKTSMNINLVVENIGSATLNEAVFRDIIPADFKPPELSEVIVSLGEEELRSGITRELDPNDNNPEVQHALLVKVENLSTAGGLRQGDQLLVKYPLTAFDPKPKVEYSCPLDITANVAPPGPPVKTSPISAQVEVKYVRRRIRAIKGQQPGEEPGEYIIPIVFENKGEVLIENITLKDIIPLNFNLLDWNPKEFKPEIQQIAKGTQLIWKIAQADAGEKIEFNYTIKGTGEYEREELEVIVG